jgi:hypothetical protein
VLAFEQALNRSNDHRLIVDDEDATARRRRLGRRIRRSRFEVGAPPAYGVSRGAALRRWTDDIARKLLYLVGSLSGFSQCVSDRTERALSAGDSRDQTIVGRGRRRAQLDAEARDLLEGKTEVCNEKAEWAAYLPGEGPKTCQLLRELGRVRSETLARIIQHGARSYPARGAPTRRCSRRPIQRGGALDPGGPRRAKKSMRSILLTRAKTWSPSSTMATFASASPACKSSTRVFGVTVT